LKSLDKIEPVATHVLDSSFETLRSEFDSGCETAAKKERAELLRALNAHFRRFRSYQNESDWVQTTLDAAAPYAEQVALFSLNHNTLLLRGQVPLGMLPEPCSFAVSEAGAFASAIESKDPVTALRTTSEVSALLSEGHAAERAHLFPISNAERVSAVLFASDAGSDMNALELMAGLASSVLERKANVALHAQITAAIPAADVAPAPVLLPVPVPDSKTKLPAWGDLPADQRQLHIRAQRFARVAVAELQLARPEACKAGRVQSDLYLFLKREIDKARENYRKQFMTVSMMVDYLHLELIQVAAEGDERLLGADYPGRLA
jgi:hypothetical protein